MVEVGLVRFAKVAPELAKARLPDYRSKFSKRTFTSRNYWLSSASCATRTGLCEGRVRLTEHGGSLGRNT
jgi:hypothetical protein